ncbi:MAG: hypothetical protein SNG38_06275 [Rikenellaceae bacterium]
MNIYFYPNVLLKKSTTANPFARNFIEYLSCEDVCITNKPGAKSYNNLHDMVEHHSDTDVYILNWIEDLPYLQLGFIQSIIFALFFYAQKFRGKKFVWVYHNLDSHKGGKIGGKQLRNILIKGCDMFITLSQQAHDTLSEKSNKKVLFLNHPINPDLLKIRDITIDDTCKKSPQYDILIWGIITQYKGIIEFLEFIYKNGFESRYKILIIGKCKDKNYESQIFNLCNDNIKFENRRVDFPELKEKIANSKIVLFPYVGESISSSGALIDTITLNGRSVGSHKGAFIDLEKRKVCSTYKNYEDIIDILSNGVNIKHSDIDSFIADNSWRSFAKSVIKELKKL